MYKKEITSTDQENIEFYNNFFLQQQKVDLTEYFYFTQFSNEYNSEEMQWQYYVNLSKATSKLILNGESTSLSQCFKHMQLCFHF